MERTISVERMVALEFQAAVSALAAEAKEIVLDDPATGRLDLHADLVGFDVAREVDVALGAVRQLDPHAVVLPISWEAVEHPRRFPTFTGMLELSDLSHHPAQTQVALVGTVHAPFGVLGTVGEALGGTDVGDAVLDALVDRLVDRLRATVAERQAAAAATVTPSHLSRPRLVLDD